MVASNLKVVYRKLASIKPDQRNPRSHSAEQVAELRASFKEFGFYNPILLRPNGMIGAGHGRFEAAKAEGLKEVPTITLGGLSENQWRALQIADNKLALNASWNNDLLKIELTELSGAGFDIQLLGFSLPELSTLDIVGFQSDVILEEADKPSLLPENPVVMRGELWLCEQHRIFCGDATNKSDVQRALGGLKPNLMVTDPPYGVNYDANWRNEIGISLDGTIQRLKTGRVRKRLGARAIGKVQNDNRADWREAWQHYAGNVAYVWHGAIHGSVVQESLKAAGFALRTQIIWNKSAFVISRGDYHYRHEPCWHAVRKGKPGNRTGGRDQTTVWDINHRKSDTGHSTQKPVDCMRRPILNNSRTGDYVYDPFIGSGTTMIAAQMEGRRCIGIELHPAYAEMAIRRWEKFTGNTATREDGKNLEELQNNAAGRRRKSIPRENAGRGKA